MDLIESNSKLASLRAPITPVKNDEERSALLASIAGLDPPAQLRLYLTVGTRPPADLLTPQNITSAIQLDDCWKYARLLTKLERTIDATAVLDASDTMMRMQTRPSIKPWVKGLLSVARLWQIGTPPTVPSYATAIAFLLAANRIMDNRAEEAAWSMGKPDRRQLLINLVAIALDLTELYPSALSLTSGADLLTKAVGRHGLDLDTPALVFNNDKNDSDRRALSDRAGALWNRLETELKAAVATIRLDDIRVLLRVLSNFPGKTRQFREVIAASLAEPDLDPACRQLLSEYTDPMEHDGALVFAPDLRREVEATELARVLMKAWDVSVRLASGEELVDEVMATLKRLFGLTLIGDAGQPVPYNPSIHEFEFGAIVSDSVNVVRPGVRHITTDQSAVIFKAVVRAQNEHSDVE